MKKLVVLVAMVAFASTAFAQGIGMSAGAGVIYSPSSSVMSSSVLSIDTKSTTTTSSVDIAAFFDATYVQLDLGLLMRSRMSKTDLVVGTVATSFDTDYPANYKQTDMAISVLGKLPISVLNLSVFPMAGVEYDLNLSATGKDSLSAEAKANLNQLWIKAGVGADIGVTDSIYIRPLVLVGYKILSQGDKDAKEALDLIADNVTLTIMKLDLGVMVGFRL